MSTITTTKEICDRCGKEIKAGVYALLETGFIDGKPVSSYTCCTSIEEWIEESGQVETENKDAAERERKHIT